MEKSMLRPVMMVLFGPLYTTLVQASVLVVIVNIAIDKIADKLIVVSDFFIIHPVLIILIVL